MQISKRSMNWFPKKSAWREMQAERQKRRAMVQEFQSKNQSLANSLSNAFSTQLSGKVENITRTAIDRLQKQTAELKDQQNQKFDKLDQLI